jgi:hypothetical protein
MFVRSRAVRLLTGAVACALALIVSGCGKTPPGPSASGRCDRQAVAAHWRAVTAPAVRYSPRFDKERERLARLVIACRFLRDGSRPDAMQLLGEPDKSHRFPGDNGGETWGYPLAPDPIEIDSQLLYVDFNKDHRVIRVALGHD